MEQTFTATDEASLRTELEQKGYYLFSVRRALGLKQLGLRRTRVPPDVLLLFAQELAALLRAGLPLLQSLDVMLERQRNPVFRQSLLSVRERVRSGVALSEAFRAEGDLYPPMLSASLVAGERSGALEAVLRRFVQYVRLTQVLKKKAIAASVYPLMLLVMMVALVGILMVKVIPQFQDFYSGLEVELPAITRGLIAIANVVRGNLPLLLLVLAGAWIAGALWLRREESGVILDRMLLRLPYVGGLMRMYATSQLCRSLSALLAGGLPLVNALGVAATSVGNRALSRAVVASTVHIKEGRSLTQAFESTGLIDNLALEMVKVGEQTGALADMLSAISDFYDEELETRMQKVIALVEPVMLVLMAVIVGFMLLAFYLPLFEAISAVERRV
ncbi:MAG TPA: type II secretion system F family protein [Vicinamibacteria bacterium]|nr:type II secretion system F family protein [Vicinamibacteria bacterium]